jgi:hypothetical protein
MAGLNLSDFTFLDSLTFTTGLLGSYDRIRGIYDFRFPFGWLSEMDVKYKGFGIHGTVYSGNSQVIISGDGFYKSSFYSRADVYYQAGSSAIQGKLQFSFHFIPDVMDLSMSLVIRAKLDGIFGRHQSN